MNESYLKYLRALKTPTLGFSIVNEPITQYENPPGFEFLEPLKEKSISLYMYDEDKNHPSYNYGKRRYSLGHPDEDGIRFASCVEGDRRMSAIAWCNHEKTHFYFEIEEKSQLIKVHFWINDTGKCYWSNRYRLVYLDISDY